MCSVPENQALLVSLRLIKAFQQRATVNVTRNLKAACQLLSITLVSYWNEQHSYELELRFHFE